MDPTTNQQVVRYHGTDVDTDFSNDDSSEKMHLMVAQLFELAYKKSPNEADSILQQVEELADYLMSHPVNDKIKNMCEQLLTAFDRYSSQVASLAIWISKNSYNREIKGENTFEKKEAFFPLQCLLKSICKVLQVRAKSDQLWHLAYIVSEGNKAHSNSIATALRKVAVSSNIPPLPQPALSKSFISQWKPWASKISSEISSESNLFSLMAGVDESLLKYVPINDLMRLASVSKISCTAARLSLIECINSKPDPVGFSHLNSLIKELGEKDCSRLLKLALKDKKIDSSCITKKFPNLDFLKIYTLNVHGRLTLPRLKKFCIEERAWTGRPFYGLIPGQYDIKCENLEDFTLSITRDLSLNFVKQFSKLKTFSIQGNLENIDFVPITECKNIEEISMNDQDNCFSETINLSFLLKFEKLKAFSITTLRNIDVCSIQNCKNLEKLKINSKKDERYILLKIEITKDLHSVKFLNLRNVDLGQSINYFPNLERLEYKSRIPPTPSKKLLHMRHAHFTHVQESKSWEDCKFLKFFPNLKKLEFYECGLENLNFLKYVPNLTELSVTGHCNYVADISALSYCTQLTTIELPTARGITSEILVKLPCLKKISFSNNRPSREMINLLEGKGIIVEMLHHDE
jgi:hypothetical protein